MRGVRRTLESTELVEADPPARNELYSGFGNALSLGFEFVATVGLFYLLGHWMAGTIGGVVGIVVGWIGAIVRLYFQFQPDLPVAKRAQAGK